jgi:hypothetical protein
METDSFSEMLHLEELMIMDSVKDNSNIDTWLCQKCLETPPVMY